MAKKGEMDFAVGKVFGSWDEFDAQFSNFCRSTGSVFVRKGARAVETKNKTVKGEAAKYPLHWKYTHVQLICKHYGTYQSKSTGSRRDQSTFKTDCKARVVLSANKAKKGLLVTACNLHHTGHDVSPDKADPYIYPEMRKLSEEQVKEMCELKSLGLKVTDILSYFLNKHGLKLMRHDVHNKIQRMKKAADLENIMECETDCSDQRAQVYLDRAEDSIDDFCPESVKISADKSVHSVADKNVHSTADDSTTEIPQTVPPKQDHLMKGNNACRVSCYECGASLLLSVLLTRHLASDHNSCLEPETSGLDSPDGRDNSRDTRHDDSDVIANAETESENQLVPGVTVKEEVTDSWETQVETDKSTAVKKQPLTPCVNVSDGHGQNCPDENLEMTENVTQSSTSSVIAVSQSAVVNNTETVSDIEMGKEVCASDRKQNMKTADGIQTSHYNGSAEEEDESSCDISRTCFGLDCGLERQKTTPTGKQHYNCDICGLLCAHLLRHIEVDAGENMNPHDVCCVRGAARQNTQDQVRLHATDYPYKCDTCGVSFLQKLSLQRHANIHTGNKPYMCDVCGLTFTRSSHLKTHKVVHMGEKPYTCDICGISFARGRSLQEHQKTHTGLKPFRCDICNVHFAQKRALRKHKQRHAGEKSYTCAICGADFLYRGELLNHTVKEH